MINTLTIPLWFRRFAMRKAAPPRAIELLAGQRLDVVLASGSGLRVAAGEVVLSRPAQLLAESLWLPGSCRLREGEQWTSIQRERVTVQASRASRVLLHGGEPFAGFA